MTTPRWLMAVETQSGVSRWQDHTRIHILPHPPHCKLEAFRCTMVWTFMCLAFFFVIGFANLAVTSKCVLVGLENLFWGGTRDGMDLITFDWYRDFKFTAFFSV